MAPNKGSAKKMSINVKRSPVEEWWFSHPFVTRYWCVSLLSVLVSMLVTVAIAADNDDAGDGAAVEGL